MFFNKWKKKIVGISGMHCDKCAMKIDSALEELSDVENVKVNLKKNNAIIYYVNHVDNLLIQKVIEDLGYTVTGIKEVR